MKDVIIACDFASREELRDFLKKLGNIKPFLKIGMEMFYTEGPELVRVLKSEGYKIFLDLKLCDIPNTVKRSMAAIRDIGADICNLHAFGGSDMMKAAVEGLTRADGTRPLLIAVTELTSITEEIAQNEQLVCKPLPDVILSYAQNAKNSGLDGVVCSPLEAGMIHEKIGSEFLTVTPGIRFSDAKTDDQNRFTTPEKAREIGSDYIVVGRPITASANPKEAYEKCLKGFLGL